VKPVGKPDAGNRLVRFDERGWETERCRMAQATAPILDSTTADLSRAGPKDVIVLAAAGRRSQRRIDALQDGARRQS
jgi:hypothetical protein